MIVAVAASNALASGRTSLNKFSGLSRRPAPVDGVGDTATSGKWFTSGWRFTFGEWWVTSGWRSATSGDQLVTSGLRTADIADNVAAKAVT